MNIQILYKLLRQTWSSCVKISASHVFRICSMCLVSALSISLLMGLHFSVTGRDSSKHDRCRHKHKHLRWTASVSSSFHYGFAHEERRFVALLSGEALLVWKRWKLTYSVIHVYHGSVRACVSECDLVTADRESCSTHAPLTINKTLSITKSSKWTLIHQL